MKAIWLILSMSLFSLNAIASTECNQNESIIKQDATQLLSRQDFESITHFKELPKAGVYYRYFRLIRDTYSSEFWYDSERNILKYSVFSMGTKNQNPKSKTKTTKLTNVQREQYFCLIKNVWESKIPSKEFEEKDDTRKKLCATKMNNEGADQKIYAESLRIFKNCQSNLGDKNKLCEKITGVHSTPGVIDEVTAIDECGFGQFPYLMRSSYHDSQKLILVDKNDFKVFEYSDADSPAAKELRAFFYAILE